MLDKHAALKGAQQAVGSEPIEDIGIAYPVGTLRTQLGADAMGEGVGLAAGAAASLSGLSIANAGAGGGGLGQLVADYKLDHTGSPASIVLALTATKLYLLGRYKVGPLASFKNLEVVHVIPRGEVEAKLEPSGGITKTLTITDEESGESFTYEVKPLGSGMGDVVDALDGGR